MKKYEIDQHFVFWKISNAFILMPKTDAMDRCDDDEIMAFKDLSEMFSWLEKFYKAPSEQKGEK